MASDANGDVAMFIVSQHLARKLARDAGPTDTWDELRDMADLSTGGELSGLELDALADWMTEALAQAA